MPGYQMGGSKFFNKLKTCMDQADNGRIPLFNSISGDQMVEKYNFRRPFRPIGYME